MRHIIYLVRYVVKRLGGIILDSINFIIADNLKRLREERKLSLDAVSKLSGVSKSMLGQIERGEVSPTISTVWKISNGLKISFTELMSRSEADYEVVDSNHIQPLLEDDGKCRNYPVFPFDSERRFEIYYLELDVGSQLNAESHPLGTQEFITAFSGRLSVSVDNETFSIGSGGSLRFKADRPHLYQNTGDELCRVSMVIYYPR